MNGVGSEAGDFASGVEDVFLAGFDAWGELGQVSGMPTRQEIEKKVPTQWPRGFGCGWPCRLAPAVARERGVSGRPIAL